MENNSKSSMDAIKGKDGLFAIMKTSKGEIVLELYYKETPLTVTNFVGLAEGTLKAANGKPYYNGLKFHRVIENFMIQGGDPTGTGSGGPGYRFADEIVDDLKFTGPGILAMANAGAGTNGSQFFITHVETPWLNGKHTIFGKVVTGQDVVNAVKQGDKIEGITIVRQGSDAEKFTASQDDFDRLSKEAAATAAAKLKKQHEKTINEIKSKYPDAKETDDGIFYKTTKAGKGAKAGNGVHATVEYKGYLLDGSLFDASKNFHPQGHDPLDFKTGAGQMIPGFDEMVQDMNIGEVRTMILPPELAYGEQGYPGVIPGNAYICFDVELVDFE